MDKNELLERARKFCKGELSFEEASKVDFIMFIISKFILLKEKIILKDFKEDILYFDYDKQEKYVNNMMSFVDNIVANGAYFIENEVVAEIKISEEKRNELISNLGPIVYDKYINHLKKCVWIFNKIRDTFSHFRYDIDTDGNIIKLKNIKIDDDKIKKDSKPFVLICDIPLDELIKLLFILDENKKTNENIYDYLKRIQDNFWEQYTKMSTTLLLNIKKSSKGSNSEAEELFNFILKHQDFLRNIIRLMMSSHVNIDELKTTLRTSVDIGDNVDTTIEKVLDVITAERSPMRYNVSLEKVVENIATNLRLKKEDDLATKGTTLFHYMNVLFSFNEYKKKELQTDFEYLQMSEFEYEVKDNEHYKNNIVKLNNQIYSFIENLEKNLKNINQMIDENKQVPNSFINSCELGLNSLCDIILEKNKILNVFIVTSIRNSIMHANVSFDGNCMILKDKINQNSEVDNFECKGTLDSYIKFSESLEKGIDKSNFNILTELKSKITNEVFNYLIKVILEAEITFLKIGKKSEISGKLISNITPDMLREIDPLLVAEFKKQNLYCLHSVVSEQVAKKR